jgi:hypothetical protein
VVPPIRRAGLSPHFRTEEPRLCYTRESTNMHAKLRFPCETTAGTLFGTGRSRSVPANGPTTFGHSLEWKFRRHLPPTWTAKVAGSLYPDYQFWPPGRMEGGAAGLNKSPENSCKWDANRTLWAASCHHHSKGSLPPSKANLRRFGPTHRSQSYRQHNARRSHRPRCVGPRQARIRSTWRQAAF